ncbi:hypothetical protein HK096_010915 [Nowakowskiella sp. JEL0078]|nr:hypothetical protein HK096_010915 [Nowakowskiella sp. JEL0078]
MEQMLLKHEEKTEALVSSYFKAILKLTSNLTSSDEKHTNPDDHRAYSFEKIFDKNFWGNKESKSGRGSTMAATVNARKFISSMWKIFNVKSFLDSPCGDCNWQPSIPGFEHINYTGVDIVTSAIKHDTIKYFGRNNMRFAILDLVRDGHLLPKNEFDIVMCRDAIQHLSLEDGMKIYQALEATGAKVLITNIHIPKNKKISNISNKNIQPGEFYLNNPLLEPFNFGMPVFYTFDTPEKDQVKLMAAFELPIIGKGDGNFDINLFETKNLNGMIIPVGERGRQLWDEYQERYDPKKIQI